MSEVKRYEMMGKFETSEGKGFELINPKMVLEQDFEAQRLRADTAEAERDDALALAGAWKEQERLRGIQAINASSDLAAAEQRLEQFTGLIEEFCQRVEAGEVRSRVTYAKFKAAINPNTEAESHGK